MIVTIHQPDFLPWLGFFDKLLTVDKIIIMDNVQFKKRYFENRNKIRTKQGWAWINTPVLTKGKFNQKIMDVKIDNSRPWQRKITSALKHNYGNATYWEAVGEELCELISKPYDRLVDFNLSVICFFMKKMEINLEYSLASTLDTDHSGSGLILEICRKVKTVQYLSGRDGRNYLDEKEFIDNGIEIIYQDFKHPVYDHFMGHFMPEMSVVDLFFNHGRDSVDIIKGTGLPKITGHKDSRKKICV